MILFLVAHPKTSGREERRARQGRRGAPRGRQGFPTENAQVDVLRHCPRAHYYYCCRSCVSRCLDWFLICVDVRCCFWFLICVQVWRRVKPIHRIWLVFIASYCYKIIVNRMARRRTLAVRAHKPTKTPTRNVTDHRSNHESIMYAPTHSWSHSPFATLEPSFTRTDQYLPSPS
jgi:hypothetical protein